MASNVIKQPLQYENVQVNGISGDGSAQPKPHPLQSHKSEPNIKVVDRSSEGASADSATNNVAKATTAKSEHAVREAKYKLLIPVGPERGGECAQCKELSQLLSLWELGVGGIARNCSKILAQLNQARDAHTALECRLREKAEVDDSAAPPVVTKSLNVSRTQKAAFRKSLYDETATAAASAGNGNGSGSGYVVEQMYPSKAASPGVPASSSSECISLPYDHYLETLNGHLGQAIDLCQQLAAACFKSNQSVSSTSAGDTPRLRRQPTAPAIKSSSALPKSSKNASTPLTSYRPPLQSLVEEKSPKLHHVASFTRTSSSPRINATEEDGLKGAGSDSELQNPSRESERLANQMVSPAELEDGWVKVNMNGNDNSPPDKRSGSQDDSKSDSSSVSSRSPYHNPVLTVLGVSEGKKLAKEAQKSEASEMSELVLSSSSCESDHVRDSILSTYSDSDVKQVMSKIASLEEERIRLLDTIDKLHKDNQLVRLSLGEILGDLESKDLQLSLAMQDLSIATDEITKAAEFRSRLDRLEREKQQQSEHLSNLEDESAAVKVSLIRLLQEKSATNKTLALENWRLSQRMRNLSVRKASKGSGGSQTTPSAPSPTPGADGDNVSLVSGFSTFDEGLQEAYIGFDDAGHFVHKQGFLKKQGAKVKSWKRRLFVLNTDGLSYFKTEQPIQTIPLDKIDRVQVCHGRTIHPNMFEVYTQGRVFFLSAPSEDEMQSWVGMLQTLKQYNRVTAQAQLQAQSIAQAQAQAMVNAEAIDSSPQAHRRIVQAAEDELEPVNLPPIHGHQPLSSAAAAPFPYGDKLKEVDSELAILSEELADEPKVAVSLPTSPTSFGGTKVDSHANSIIESLNLQI